MVDAKKREKQRAERAFDEKGPLQYLIGPPMRGVVGLLLIAGTGYWLYLNGLIGEFPNPTMLMPPENAEPIPFAPIAWLFTSISPGVGGLIMLISIVLKRRNIVWLSWPAAAAAVLGPVFLVAFVSLTFAMFISVGAAVAIAAMGIVYKR
jgi:hypothetical protein